MENDRRKIVSKGRVDGRVAKVYYDIKKMRGAGWKRTTLRKRES